MFLFTLHHYSVLFGGTEPVARYEITPVTTTSQRGGGCREVWSTFPSEITFSQTGRPENITQHILYERHMFLMSLKTSNKYQNNITFQYWVDIILHNNNLTFHPLVWILVFDTVSYDECAISYMYIHCVICKTIKNVFTDVHHEIQR